MKKRYRIAMTVMSVFMLLGSACNSTPSNNKGTTNKGTTDGEEIVVTKNDYKNGLHQIDYTLTDDYVVRNNQTDYSILIPNSASEEVLFAAEELQALFEEATKATLPIIVESTTISSDKKIISLGNTNCAISSDVKATAELGRYGYTIKTVNKSIFVNANSDVGVTYGVYGLLELMFNFDCFSDVLYYIDKQDDTFLYNYNVKDAPDMDTNLSGTQYTEGNALRRMRFVKRDEITAGNTSVHTTLSYIKPDEYISKNENYKKWFTANKLQLCYTANGDEEYRDLLVTEVANMIADYFKRYPTQFYFNFSQMDENVWCGCEACKDSFDKYGSNAAVVIKFMNDVAEAVDAWMETEEGLPYKRDYKIAYLAYQKTLSAPAKFNKETEKYEPIDNSIIPHKHTQIIFAPLEIDYTHSIYDKCNAAFLNIIRGWQSITDNVALYLYNTNYTAFWVYYDCFDGLKDLMQLSAELNCGWFYMEGHWQQSGGSGWTALKNYVVSKLAWNVNLDINKIIDKFFDHYYADASDEMYQVFLDTRLISRMNEDRICRSSSVYADIDEAGFWPKNMLVNCLNIIEEGLADITYIQKTDPKKYQAIYGNIVSERVAYGYLLAEHYADDFDKDYILNLKLQTMRDANNNGISWFSTYPRVLASEVWSRWGIV